MCTYCVRVVMCMFASVYLGEYMSTHVRMSICVCDHACPIRLYGTYMLVYVCVCVDMYVCILYIYIYIWPVLTPVCIHVFMA